MAYTFNNINGLMGPDEEKANIFAPGGSDANLPQNQAGGGQGNASGGTVKTDTGSDIGNVTGSTGAPGPGSSTGQKQTNQTDVLEKNQYQQDPGFTTELQNNISKGQQDLQNEANSYTAAQNAKGDQRLSDADLSAAAGGDAAASSNVTGYLNQSQTADPFANTVNTNYGDLDQLGNAKSLASYLQSRGGSISNSRFNPGGQNYNSGMAGLDASLLFKNPNFQQGISQAKAQRDALQAMAQKYGAGDATTPGLQAQSQAYIDQGLGAGKQAARQSLTDYAGAVQDPIYAQLKSENDARSNLMQNKDPNYIRQQTQSVIDQIKKEHPELAPYLVGNEGLSNISYATPGGTAADTPAVDPSQFYHAGGYVNANDLTTADQATKYNHIMDLLGNGGARMTAGNGASPRESFDTAGLKNALVGNAGGIQAALKTEADKKFVAEVTPKITDALTQIKDRKNTARIGRNMPGVGDQGVPVGLTEGDMQQLSAALGLPFQGAAALDKVLQDRLGTDLNSLQDFVNDKGAVGGAIGQAIDSARGAGGQASEEAKGAGGKISQGVKTGRF